MGVNCPCFSSMLTRALSERGATAHWLAKAMNTQQRQIDGWLHGVRLPTTDSLDDLTDALDVKFEFLVLIRLWTRPRIGSQSWLQLLFGLDGLCLVTSSSRSRTSVLDEGRPSKVWSPPSAATPLRSISLEWGRGRICRRATETKLL